jgi:hypothetical protein
LGSDAKMETPFGGQNRLIQGSLNTVKSSEPAENFEKYSIRSFHEPSLFLDRNVEFNAKIITAISHTLDGMPHIGLDVGGD